jgi:ATP-dependent Clp protease ATP-binding subunit ClpA
MFERFTDGARRVVLLGQDEARTLNHDYVGTEHLLLGLVHDTGGVAAKALEGLGISLETVRQQVVEIIGRGRQAPPGHIPFTPRAKNAMELAQQESDALGHDFIDTEHLLLGLIREGGVAAQVLAQLGADLDSVRQQVLALTPHQSRTGVLGAPGRRGKRERERLLDEALARLGKMDQRLTAIERWVGMPPDLDDLDREIAEVRGEKETAIDGNDFESAAALRHKEKALLERRMIREKQWTAAAGDRVSPVAELGRVKAELERLRAIMRQHGVGGAA